MKRMAGAVALLIAASLMAGCSADTQEACEDRGGVWVTHLVMMPVHIGKVTTLQPIPISECVMPASESDQ